MKVKYIDCKRFDCLTHGKVYDVIENRNKTYLIMCDIGVVFYFDKSKFEVVGG